MFRPLNVYIKLTLSLTGLLLILNFTGCAQLYVLQNDVEDPLTKWIEDGQYGKALNLIEIIKPNHKQYEFAQKQLERVQRLAAQYEANTLSEAESLTKNNHWQQAEDLYDTALEILPKSKKLAEAKEAFIQARDKHIQGLEFQLLLSKGQALPKITPIINSIANANPKNLAAVKAAEENFNEVTDTAEALTDCGIDAINREDYKQAKLCLDLAQELTPSDKISQALVIANKHITKKQKAVEKQQKKSKEKKAKQYIAGFETAFQEKDYAKAKKFIDQLQEYLPSHPSLTQLNQTYDNAINEEVKRAIDAGQQYYSEGEYENAYTTWRHGLNLSPNDSTLLAHIERVQRVLDSLKRLNTQKNPIPFPTE